MAGKCHNVSALLAACMHLSKYSILASTGHTLQSVIILVTKRLCIPVQLADQAAFARSNSSVARKAGFSSICPGVSAFVFELCNLPVFICFANENGFVSAHSFIHKVQSLHNRNQQNGFDVDIAFTGIMIASLTSVNRGQKRKDGTHHC